MDFKRQHAETDSGLWLVSNGSSLTEINEALISLQGYYNSPVDGTLNQETLISKPRCGVKDNATAYRVHYQKWNETTSVK